MPIIRNEKKTNFTVIDNGFIRNRELSLKAKGLLTQMLSLPEDWDFSVRGLAAISKEGASTIRSILKELEAMGYVKIEPVRTHSGKYDRIYHIYENPDTLPAGTENTGVTNTGVANAGAVNRPQINKEKRNKDKRSRVTTTTYPSDLICDLEDTPPAAASPADSAYDLSDGSDEIRWCGSPPASPSSFYEAAPSESTADTFEDSLPFTDEAYFLPVEELPPELWGDEYPVACRSTEEAPPLPDAPPMEADDDGFIRDFDPFEEKPIPKNTKVPGFFNREPPLSKPALETFRGLIRANTEYEIFAHQPGFDSAQMLELINLAAELAACPNPSQWIGGQNVPTEQVRDRMLQLRATHLQYVMECMAQTTTPIRNIRRYLATTLYNAPATIESYYNHQYRRMFALE